MAAFLATCEGRGKRLTRTGSEKTGAFSAAGTWNVRAEAGARVAGSEKMGAPIMLELRLQTLCDSGGKAHGGVQAQGAPVVIWAGTEADALALCGALGPAHQLLALREAARHLASLADANLRAASSRKVPA